MMSTFRRKKEHACANTWVISTGSSLSKSSIARNWLWSSKRSSKSKNINGSTKLLNPNASTSPASRRSNASDSSLNWKNKYTSSNSINLETNKWTPKSTKSTALCIKVKEFIQGQCYQESPMIANLISSNAWFKSFCLATRIKVPRKRKFMSITRPMILSPDFYLFVFLCYWLLFISWLETNRYLLDFYEFSLTSNPNFLIFKIK